VSKRWHFVRVDEETWLELQRARSELRYPLSVSEVFRQLARCPQCHSFLLNHPSDPWLLLCSWCKKTFRLEVLEKQ
jgi:hypothetical protein